MSLLSVEQARERILSQLHPVGTETIPLTACVNRVLGADIVAADALPLFDNSSMDGFAIRAADTSNAAPASSGWSATWLPTRPLGWART